jgi:hypothetical protein
LPSRSKRQTRSTTLSAPAPFRDQPVEVREHLVHRVHPVGGHAGDALLAREEAPHELVEHLAVFHREAIREAGDLHRDLRGELIEDVGLAQLAHFGEGVVDEPRDLRLEPLHARRGEEPDHGRPKHGMERRVEAIQHRCDGLNFRHQLGGRRALRGRVAPAVHRRVPDVVEARQEIRVPLGEVEAGVLFAQPGVDRVRVFQDLCGERVVVDHRRNSPLNLLG